MENHNLSSIKGRKPRILSPNHVNAFIDPIIIASQLSQNVHFFARSDAFKSRFSRWIFKQMKIGPMYRIQEGYSNLKNNNKTFEICKTLLSNDKTIIMFPEGLCIMEFRVRKLKKGLGRILFDTEEAFDFKKDVYVVPIGLNYSEADKFGSKLFINVGKPMDVVDYKEQYKTDKVKAINEFTKELERRMQELLVVVNNKEYDDLYKSLVKIYVDEKMYGSKNKSLKKEHELNCKVAEALNRHDGSYFLNSLKEKAKIYFSELTKGKLDDTVLYKEKIEKQSAMNIFGQAFLLLLGFPVFLFGVITNYLPYFIAKRIANKIVKNIEFYASIYFSLSMLLSLFYYAIQLLAIALIFRSWPLLGIYFVTAVVCGLMSIKYFKLFEKIKMLQRLLSLTRKNSQVVEELLIKRMEIVDMTEALMSN